MILLWISLVVARTSNLFCRDLGGAVPGTRVVLIATPPQELLGKKLSLTDAMFSAHSGRRSCRIGFVAGKEVGSNRWLRLTLDLSQIPPQIICREL